MTPAWPARLLLVGCGNMGGAMLAGWLAAGGTACEDPPGVRSNDFGSLYLAYLRDPDGNKICALHRMAS